MKAAQFIAVLSCTSFFIACSSDNSETLMDNAPVTGQVTYTQNVKAIIDNNCIVCHATVPVNGAPMSLVTYENVKDAVLTSGLLDRISIAQGASGMMPLGGTRLPQTTIDKISQWAQNGQPE